MKTRKLIMAASFLLIGSGLYAQTAATQNDATPNAVAPTVTKGYYSIGNNATKVRGKSAVAVKTSDTYPTVQKGYYSIGNNNRKLQKQIVVDANATSFVPFVSKGYYSIGRNNEKLKQ